MVCDVDYNDDHRYDQYEKYDFKRLSDPSTFMLMLLLMIEVNVTGQNRPTFDLILHFNDDDSSIVKSNIIVRFLNIFT